MKELLIKVSVDNNTGRIASIVKHRGFSNGEYSIEQILLTIGILDNLKIQMLAKMEQKLNISKIGGENES